MTIQFFQLSWFDLEFAIKYILYTLTHFDNTIFATRFEEFFTPSFTPSRFSFDSSLCIS